jgi:hypothetical protein
MSTSSYTFPNMFTPQTVGLGVGLLASSFMFLGNVAAARLGVMHMLKKENRERYGIQPGQALQLWDAWYDRAAYVFVSSMRLLHPLIMNVLIQSALCPVHPVDCCGALHSGVLNSLRTGESITLYWCGIDILCWSFHRAFQ